MSGMKWLPWMTGNRNYWWTRGPVYAGWGQVIVGVQAREQGGYGVVDLAFCAKGVGEPRCSGTRGEDWSPWVTGNRDYHWESAAFRAPPEHVLVGFDVRDQPGYGIVDLRCLLRRWDGKALARPIVEGPWLCGNPNGDSIRCAAPYGCVVAGVDVREQGGYGVVDLRIAAVSIDEPAVFEAIDRIAAMDAETASV